MKKIKCIILVAIILVLVFGSIIRYRAANHYIDYQYITEIEEDVEKDEYTILYSQEELEYFESLCGDIELPPGFDFEKDALLITSGHCLKRAYYNISDDEKFLATSHFIYVMLDREKENKVYVYSISNRYNDFFFSQKYTEDYQSIFFE